MTINTDPADRQVAQGALAADAARIARDPVAGSYLFGSLAAALAAENRLCYLSSAVTQASAFAGPSDPVVRAIAEFRQTAASLDRHLVEHPDLFGKASRALLAQCFVTLNQVAFALETAPEPAAAAG